MALKSNRACCLSVAKGAFPNKGFLSRANSSMRICCAIEGRKSTHNRMVHKYFIRAGRVKIIVLQTYENSLENGDNPLY